MIRSRGRFGVFGARRISRYPRHANALKRLLRAACEGVELVLEQPKLLDHGESELIILDIVLLAPIEEPLLVEARGAEPMGENLAADFDARDGVVSHMSIISYLVNPRKENVRF